MDGLRILILEDNPADAHLIEYELNKGQEAITFQRATNREEFVALLGNFKPDLILADFMLPKFNALEALQVVRSSHLDIPFILLTGTLPEEVAVECMKNGADDYILKSNLKRLPMAINQALNVRRIEAERKQLEAQLLRAQRLESIGTLAGGIAHDLNNVLAPILMGLQLMRKRHLDSHSQKLINLMEASAQHGAELVKQVLSFARGIEGEHTAINIKHLVKDIEKVLKGTLPRSIKIVTDIPEEIWPVKGDATQLHQVLMNLAVNARDAMPQGGVLTIRAENSFIDAAFANMQLVPTVGPHITISVADTGTGIAPEILDRIFEPFFSTKEIGQGTGLGLSTVLGIVKSHGGFIDVSSTPGQGTAFKVYVPAIAPTVTQASLEERSEALYGHGELIMIVDDESSIREITKTTLEAYGYETLTASDGVEAVASYAERKAEIDLVIVDVMMPIMDGLTTIRALQKLDPGVKIIAISGVATKEKVADASKLGVDTFLSKPYTTEKLLATLREKLSSK